MRRHEAFRPTKVVDLELTDSPRDLEGLQGYDSVRALVRLRGVPVGVVTVRVGEDRCPSEDLLAAARRELVSEIRRVEAEGVRDIPGAPPPVTVAVCTRDRTEELAICLDSLVELDYPSLDLLVVDNAPASDATERLVRARYPSVRYVREPRPGLDWARNRAIAEAKGDIVAYTDDDCVVDPQWVRAIATAFAHDPAVSAVTGLVEPLEIETRSQELFEAAGGFGRGYRPQWSSVNGRRAGRWRWYGAGRYGTGANMAFRTALFDEVGGFDPALDVGTVTHGGGDLEMFFRVLHAGRVLLYEPRALVRHRHRRTPEELTKQITNNGIGFASYLVGSFLRHRGERVPFVKLALWWHGRWLLRRWLLALARRDTALRKLAGAELRGALRGVTRYPRSRRVARALGCDEGQGCAPPDRPGSASKNATAVRMVGFSPGDDGAPTVGDVSGHDRVRVFVTRDGRPRGSVDIVHHGHTISPMRLQAEIAHALPEPALVELGIVPDGSSTDRFESFRSDPVRPDGLVSIVIATRDRPEDLRRCLDSLVTVNVDRFAEIVVVDNHPEAGLTAPVVSRFPRVRLVEESRRGLSYARNAGIAASNGDLVVTIDDDATVPPGWLDTLLAPFARADVLVVTGNVLPAEMDTTAQLYFESYGGLGRGFRPLLADQEWTRRFIKRAIPTWELGATANAAFRRSVFSNPEIGFLDEALGAGTPAGCSEDTDLFYRVLRSGGSVFYEPHAFVWHRHRRTLRDLGNQIRAYSRGHVAYHLGTLFRYGDRRALWRLGVELPRWYARRIKGRLSGRNRYPWMLAFWEITGSLAGPLAFWRSRRRAERLGRRGPLPPRDFEPPDVERVSSAANR